MFSIMDGSDSAQSANTFITLTPLICMDEHTIQQAREISQRIVGNEYPEEAEYFDFLFDLTIQEIKELEPGKEAEFLKEMRAVHPEVVLGFTPLIIIITVQFLGEFTHSSVGTKEIVKKLVENSLETEENRKRMLGLTKYFVDFEKEMKDKR